MSELYLYQTIHLHKGRPRLVAEHIATLNEASLKLFGRTYTPNTKELTTRIEALAGNEGYPDAVSGFVRLELWPNGTEHLLPAGISLYDGYALRSVMPNAVIVEYVLTQHDAPTSAHEATTQLMRKLAERAGASAAIRCDSEGILHSIDGAPLFAVRGKEVFTAPIASQNTPQPEEYHLQIVSSPSVEHNLGLRAIQTAGLQLSITPALRTDLPHYDEVFSIDHRGITALAHCDGIPYMSLAAERVATAMEALFKKRK